MCKDIQSTHLIFGDDLVLFHKETVYLVDRIMEAPTDFSDVTGLGS